MAAHAAAAKTPEPGPADRRAQLAESAYALIAAGGLEGLSIRALARAVGAQSTGLVSHYFLDRAEIVAAALEHATLVMRQRAEITGHPLDTLMSVLPTDDATIENWRFAFAVRAGALTDPELAAFDAAIHKHWHQQLPVALEAHGVVTAGTDPHLAVDFIVAVVDGVALRATLNPRDWPPPRQRAHVERALAAIRNEG